MGEVQKPEIYIIIVVFPKCGRSIGGLYIFSISERSERSIRVVFP